MKLIMEEYGGILLSAVTALCLMKIFADFFLTGDSLFYQMIQMWGNGGC